MFGKLKRHFFHWMHFISGRYKETKIVCSKRHVLLLLLVHIAPRSRNLRGPDRCHDAREVVARLQRRMRCKAILKVRSASTARRICASDGRCRVTDAVFPRVGTASARQYSSVQSSTVQYSSVQFSTSVQPQLRRRLSVQQHTPRLGE